MKAIEIQQALGDDIHLYKKAEGVYRIREGTPRYFYRGNSGGYGNLAVYHLIWLYRLPPECLTGNLFYNRLPFKNYQGSSRYTFFVRYRWLWFPRTTGTNDSRLWFSHYRGWNMDGSRETRFAAI